MCMLSEFKIGVKNRDNLHWEMDNRRFREENVEKNPTRGNVALKVEFEWQSG